MKKLNVIRDSTNYFGDERTVLLLLKSEIIFSNLLGFMAPENSWKRTLARIKSFGSLEFLWKSRDLSHSSLKKLERQLL